MNVREVIAGNKEGGGRRRRRTAVQRWRAEKRMARMHAAAQPKP